jgi:hypothetical protein
VANFHWTVGFFPSECGVAADCLDSLEQRSFPPRFSVELHRLALVESDGVALVGRQQAKLAFGLHSLRDTTPSGLRSLMRTAW